MKINYVKIILVVIIIILLFVVFYNNETKPLKQRLATAETELQALKAKLEKISAENKKLIALQGNIIKLQADISNLTREKEKILQENISLENNNISYKDIIKSLKQQNTELEKRIKELETTPDKSSGANPVKDTPPEIIPPKESGDNIKYASPYNSLKTLPKDKIIVVRNDECDENIRKAGGKNYKGEPLFDGNYDKIQDALSRMGIEYTLIGKSELDKESYSLDDKWVIIFNCNFFKDHCCNPEHLKQGKPRNPVWPDDESNNFIHATKLSDKTIKKIRQFVETGGYLFTEDLQINEIIERAFPGVIVHTKYLPEQEVKILPAQGTALHPYLKYVFETPPSNAAIKPPPEISTVKPVWKIDDESLDIKILKKDAVTVLIVSPKLAKANKNEGAVAVSWGYSIKQIVYQGDKPPYIPAGKVLHIMGDLGKQTILSQNLIFNFLSELNELRPREKKGK
ncbi:MAG: hypothetical protein V1709_08790 [Planctomycetota bacterium]